MNSVTELRKAIAATLRAVHPEVYYEQASKEAVYPYLTYLLPNSVDEGTLEQFVLEVDGWDAPDNGDTTGLETMMGIVDEALQRLVVVVDDRLTLRFLRDRRLALDDDKPQIRRRKYIYQVRTYERRDQNG